MRDFTFQEIGGNDIDQCRELCNELMVFQKSKAYLEPERFDAMTFDTRMRRSYQNALRSHVVIARDGDTPAGYVFSTVDDTGEEARFAYPDWAPVGEGFIGFYPDWVRLPQKTGCLSNLYLRDRYRG